MKVCIDLQTLYDRGSELVITFALLYRLAKLGSESARERFIALLSDEDFFEQAITAESDSQGNIFIMACDLLSFEEFEAVYEKVSSSNDDDQWIIEELIDACPSSFVKEHSEFFDERYDFIADGESIVDYLSKEYDDGDGIFYYMEDSVEQNPFEKMLPIIRAATTVKLKNDFMDPDYLPTGLSMYARYLDALTGCLEARNSFIKFCSDASYIEFLCDTYGIFDLMLDLLKPEEIIKILSDWNVSKVTISLGKGAPTYNCGETLYNAFLEQDEGQEFYVNNEALFEENGLENID